MEKFTICRSLDIPQSAQDIANSGAFEIKSQKFSAAAEQLRPARKVRIGLFQNKLPLATDVPVTEQRAALHHLAEKVITAAALSGVNIFCFQETWSMQYSLEQLFINKLTDFKNPFSSLNIL